MANSFRVPFPRVAGELERVDPTLKRAGEQFDRNFDELARMAGGNPGTAVIDAGDGAVITGYTKKYWIREASTLADVTGVLEVAGTTDTVVNVIRTGYALGSLTIPANATTATVTFDAAFVAGDYWQIQQTTSGTGAIGPTYYGGFV